MNLKMYILVNEDIKISKGKLGGQIGHAVGSYFYRNYRPGNPNYQIFDDYMVAQKKVLLSVPQSKLEELEGLGYIAIRDSGLTELAPNTLTCVNVGIVDFDNFPKSLEWLKNLSLYHK